MAHYLVTGGCGFIGSHLADSLIEAGHDVTILDDLSTGKIENAPHKANVIIGDVRCPDVVESALSGIDGCFHLAAVASVQKSILQWHDSHTVNTTATVNILQAISRKKNLIPVVYTSSAAVYGDNPNVPLAEDALKNPLTAYGVDKLSSDLHAKIAWEVHGIPTCGMRPFNVYGPRQDPSSPYSGVISIFADRISRRQGVTIYGSGEQVRDFVYVSDAVKAFMTAMAHLHEGHNVFNICTGRASSVNRIADTIEALYGYRTQRTYAPARQGDIAVSIGNPAKLKNILGIELTVTLAEGLSYTIERERFVA